MRFTGSNFSPPPHDQLRAEAASIAHPQHAQHFSHLTMVTVAIAGGAGSGLGSCIAKALAAASHTVILLTRSPATPHADPNITLRQVDYTSPASLVAALRGVHTVI